MDKKETKLLKAIKLFGITFPLLFISPVGITMGFRGIARDEMVLGISLLIVGAIAGIFAVIFMSKAIKNLLDHLFEK